MSSLLHQYIPISTGTYYHNSCIFLIIISNRKSRRRSTEEWSAVDHRRPQQVGYRIGDRQKSVVWHNIRTWSFYKGKRDIPLIWIHFPWTHHEHVQKLQKSVDLKDSELLSAHTKIEDYSSKILAIETANEIAKMNKISQMNQTIDTVSSYFHWCLSSVFITVCDFWSIQNRLRYVEHLEMWHREFRINHLYFNAL